MSKQHDQQNDEAGVRNVLEQLVERWNNADGAGYGELFTDDADYIDVTGTHTRGGEAIGQLHQFLFDGPLRGSRLEAGNATTEVYFLTPAVALVIGGGSSRLAEQTEAPANRASINTTVLVRHAHGWRIRAFQNNRVQPWQAAPAGAGAPANQRSTA